MTVEPSVTISNNDAEMFIDIVLNTNAHENVVWLDAAKRLRAAIDKAKEETGWCINNL